MLIRPAHPSDVDLLAALEQRAQTAAHWPIEQYRKLFDGDGPRRLAMVAERDGALAGFIVARAMPPECEIENVVVDDGHRRKGVASALLWTVLEYVRADGAQRIFLEVRESNVAARRLYAAAGFREQGRRKDYYRDPPEDALILECRTAGAARESD